MNYLDDLAAFKPLCEQEETDRALMLAEARRMPVKILTRESALLHMTASAMVVNPARTHVMMAYHNIYGTWAWTGGHADGENDLLAVARREAQEETRIEHLSPIQTGAISLEILDVPPPYQARAVRSLPSASEHDLRLHRRRARRTSKQGRRKPRRSMASRRSP